MPTTGWSGPASTRAALVRGGCRLPLSGTVDMTSTVKRHDDARAGRAVAMLGPAPDAVDAGVIGSSAMGLSGGILR